ncbi:hypothetical protein [Taibaiella helva]|uniref:hypothetical protein n=1 Tax=Taibaiella helva TaxID=2301235 RepID=UPI0013004137|nr:hypothetical protein [Taibaiella helva]
MRLLFGIPVLAGLLLCFPAASRQDSLKAAAITTTDRKPASSAGFQVLPKLGLGMSRNFLVDLGLIGYSYIPDKSKFRYYDANISIMTYIGRHMMIMPKLDLQAAVFPIDREELLCFNLGLDAGLLTDFKQTSVMLTPKAGFSLATGLLRIYYLHNFLLRDKDLFPGYGRHGVLLEINISVLQGKGFRLM